MANSKIVTLTAPPKPAENPELLKLLARRNKLWRERDIAFEQLFEIDSDILDLDLLIRRERNNG